MPWLGLVGVLCEPSYLRANKKGGATPLTSSNASEAPVHGDDAVISLCGVNCIDECNEAPPSILVKKIVAEDCDGCANEDDDNVSHDELLSS